MRMMLCGLLFFLAGCATPAKDLPGPDGSPHKLLTCDDVVDCYEEAAKLCGNYKIVNTSAHTYNEGKNSYSQMLVKCVRKERY